MDTYVVNSEFLLALDVLLMAIAGTLALDDGKSRVARWRNAVRERRLAREATHVAKAAPPGEDGEQSYPEWLDRILGATPPRASRAGANRGLKGSRTPSAPSPETREPRRA